MQPLRMYSLGNFWFLSSRGLYALDHTLYPPVLSTQTPPSAPAGRPAFESAVAAEVTSQVHPDWDATDVLLLWFAQPTGWWGGGQVDVPGSGGTKKVFVTVVDRSTPFDAACQELGHSFELQHEVLEDSAAAANATGGHPYASPYSTMSSRRYGYEAVDPEFLRPADAGLPDGGPNAEAPHLTLPANWITGPRLTGAQLLSKPAFRDSPSVIHLDGGYADDPVTLRLYALNHRLPDSGLPVVLTLPSNRRDGRRYAVELRRGGWDYDQALGEPGAPPEGLVVHSTNADQSIRYDGVAPLELASTMVDWPCTAGDFSLRLLGVDAHHEFVDVQVRGGARRSFPIRGVLLAGRFRTQHQLNSMTHDDMRNTLIVELTGHSSQSDYQAYDNDTLAGMGAVLVFLRETGIRDDAALRTMSADDQRNTAIVEIGVQTGLGQELQGLGSLDLVLIALGSLKGIGGRAPGLVTSWIRGALLGGGFRTQRELNLIDHESQRNTLIVEMTAHSNQTNYQAYDDAELEGVGAVMVLLRRLGIRDDAALRTMSADDQRNTLIVELDAQTGLGQDLQGLTNIELAQAVLGVERAL
ncbi:hypothetical protein GCM10023145_20740 [Angustibacter luteus]